MSTYPRNFKVAVFYRRVLQIYDQITGQQIFEIFVPSARKIAFLDSENLIVVQEGRSQVMICAIENQRRAFMERELINKKSDALQVTEYEENNKVSEYAMGIQVQRERLHGKV